MGTTKPPKARYFARHDSALENGSYNVIRRTRDYGTYCATFMNGDHMGSDKLAAAASGARVQAAVEAKAAELLADDLREYSATDWKRLAPKCCGGKGRL